VIRAGGYVWIIKDGSEGYTYVRSPFRPYPPPSFLLVVFRMEVALLTGVWTRPT